MRGFDFEGTRVPLLSPKGIFKPAILPELPLSFTTAPVKEGKQRPYDDGFDRDGLIRYRYRGTDPDHRDNVGMRLALLHRVPLVYFFGLVPGQYLAAWPAFVVGDDPISLAFRVEISDKQNIQRFSEGLGWQVNEPGRSNAEDAEDLRFTLAGVGARPSDVFGPDCILWVEGLTEEQCFPLIVSRLTNVSLVGTVILGVIHTGDFEGRHSRIVFEVYDRLCRARGILPPAIGFIFDREGRSEIERTDLVKRARGRVKFLSRSMYENYLLNAEAIKALISGLESWNHIVPVASEVEDWLNKAQSDPKYVVTPIHDTDRTPSIWYERVHGARVLTELFRHFSEGTVEYDKVRHGVALTKWILENAPVELNEVKTLLEDVLRQRVDAE